MNDYIIRIWGAARNGRAYRRDERVKNALLRHALDLFHERASLMEESDTHIELCKPDGEVLYAVDNF